MNSEKIFKPCYRILKKDTFSNNENVKTTNTEYPYDLEYKPYSFSTVLNAYGIKPSKRSDVTVGIIELGGGYLTSDLENCMIANGFPDWKAADHIFPVFLNGYPTDIEQNFNNDLISSKEVELDIEFVTNCIPNGRINVYFSPNGYGTFIDAVDRAIEDNCTTISISWGSFEFACPNNYIYSFEKVFEKASNRGISIFIANGDFGDITHLTPLIQNNILGFQVGYPSSSPNVVCCGGSILSLELENGSYTKYSKETSWVEYIDDHIYAGNGGLSTLFEKPSYQKNLNFKSNFNSNSERRGTPDVSGNASLYNPYALYFNGEIIKFGGVSAIPPMWAGYTAGLRCNVFLNNYLYKLPKECFHDITAGNNYPYESKKGYDLCTGLGSPNGKVLTKELLKIFKKKNCKHNKK